MDHHLFCDALHQKQNRGHMQNLLNQQYSIQQNAKKYSLSAVKNTYYLAYRDVPELLEKYAPGQRAIDYGCGTGRSTRFLKDLGFETIGVDISKEMIDQAIATDDKNHYFVIENAQIPVVDHSCHIIFSCLVLCTIATKQEIVAILKEVFRCLKDDGIFIVVTASDIFYSRDWLSYNTDYPENKHPQNGDAVKFYLKDLDLNLTNYYWIHNDYCEFFDLANLKIIEKILPLGYESDGIQWVSETKFPPYAIYVLKKG